MLLMVVDLHKWRNLGAFPKSTSRERRYNMFLEYITWDFSSPQALLAKCLIKILKEKDSYISLILAIRGLYPEVTVTRLVDECLHVIAINMDGSCQLSITRGTSADANIDEQVQVQI
ncbi:uncharacterized protein LOC113310009 isoform X2 [Papaver somniferum]|uniref:uncharacterized protein LOC113310009 isoform X2 n=1 Tax=Papaver somniferum TaxID=3469 RepID=UPI000E70390A|nr:uncharacterized protein LOC113310009 isoform X2 [Papaver somniferum]